MSKEKNKSWGGKQINQKIWRRNRSKRFKIEDGTAEDKLYKDIAIRLNKKDLIFVVSLQAFI